MMELLKKIESALKTILQNPLQLLGTTTKTTLKRGKQVMGILKQEDKNTTLSNIYDGVVEIKTILQNPLQLLGTTTKTTLKRHKQVMGILNQEDYFNILFGKWLSNAISQYKKQRK